MELPKLIEKFANEIKTTDKSLYIFYLIEKLDIKTSKQFRDYFNHELKIENKLFNCSLRNFRTYIVDCIRLDSGSKLTIQDIKRLRRYAIYTPNSNVMERVNKCIRNNSLGLMNSFDRELLENMNSLEGSNFMNLYDFTNVKDEEWYTQYLHQEKLKQDELDHKDYLKRLEQEEIRKTNLLFLRACVGGVFIYFVRLLCIWLGETYQNIWQIVGLNITNSDLNN